MRTYCNQKLLNSNCRTPDDVGVMPKHVALREV